VLPDQPAGAKFGVAAEFAAPHVARRGMTRPRTRLRTSRAYSGSPTQLQRADHLAAANDGLNSSASLLRCICEYRVSRSRTDRDAYWLVEARQRTLNNRIFDKSAITQSHCRRDVAVAPRRINRN
jgi:hypothetical protein